MTVPIHHRRVRSIRKQLRRAGDTKARRPFGKPRVVRRFVRAINMAAPTQWTAAEEAEWRAEFEKLGGEAVRTHHRGFPLLKRAFATHWLREKEIEAEKRERDVAWYVKWTWIAALAAAVLAAIGIVIALYGF